MPRTDIHKSRVKMKNKENGSANPYKPLYFKEQNTSVKCADWEVILNFPNSGLRFKVPKDQIDKYEDIKKNNFGLFDVNIHYADRLFNIDDIRRECEKHFTNPIMKDICNSPQKFNDFILWSSLYKEELENGIRGGTYNSTDHAANLFNIDYTNLTIDEKKRLLDPARKLVNDLKKYITIYSMNRIPIITDEIRDRGVISLYKVPIGNRKETDNMRDISFNFIKIIMEQAEYLRVIPNRDGRRVYDTSMCKFRK